MITLLTAFSITLGVLGAHIYYWPTFIPALGITFLYNVQRWIWVTRAVVLGSAALAYALHPTAGQLVALCAAGGLALLAGFFFPPRALPEVNAPRHLGAADAPLADGAMVMGATIGDAAAAWALETLIPHHVVNDTVGGQRVLASW